MGGEKTRFFLSKDGTREARWLKNMEGPGRGSDASELRRKGSEAKSEG